MVSVTGGLVALLIVLAHPFEAGVEYSYDVGSVLHDVAAWAQDGAKLRPAGRHSAVHDDRLVGVAGIEPATSCSPNRLRASAGIRQRPLPCLKFLFLSTTVRPALLSSMAGRGQMASEASTASAA